MNKDIIQGNWKQLKGKIREQWGELTNDEIDKLHGTAEELEGIIQKKYGYQKDRVKKEMQDFLDKNNVH